MPKLKDVRSKERPVIGVVDLQTMRFHLYQYVRFQGDNPPASILEDRMSKIREILADERLKGYYGYASLTKTKRMSHAKLQAQANLLLTWVGRWLHL